LLNISYELADKDEIKVPGTLERRFFYFHVFFRPDELLVVEFKLTFKTKVTVKDALAPLKKKVSSGQLGSLKVDPNSLKFKINSQGT